MKIRIFLLIIFLFFANIVLAEEFETQSSSQITALQQYRNPAKLYAQNFVLPGKVATFRVVAKKNCHVKFVLEYDAANKIILEEDTNENGVAVFNIEIMNDESLIGKSLGVEAFVINKNNPNDIQKAVMQTEDGRPTSSSRVYVADNNSGKGVMVSPWQQLNQFVMYNNLDSQSGYTPNSDMLYNSDTPVYIKNMRDAQDNVRPITPNTTYSN